MAQTKYVGSEALQQNIDETKLRLGNKVDKVEGKGLSTNDYTTAEKTKLDGIAEGAQVNVLEGIIVDGSTLTIDANKKSTLGKLAVKDTVAETDLASELATKINGKANSATTLAGYNIGDAYTQSEVDALLDDKADLASPALTGTPTAPTAADGTNTTQIATTAFVKNAVDGAMSDLAAALKFKGQVANLTELEAVENPAQGDTYVVQNPGTGESNALYAYNGSSWINIDADIDLSGYATIASPTFTGTPAAPTATKGDDSTKIATTAFVQAELADYAKGGDLVAITASEVTAMWEQGE